MGAPSGGRERSRRSGGAAMKTLWRIPSDAPAMVLEVNFGPHSLDVAAEVARLGMVDGNPCVAD
ncbi:MAG: hypothetical protein ACRDVW_03665 [Acidimicrobiales bacterium]